MAQLWPAVASCGPLWLWPLECRHLLLAYFHPKKCFDGALKDENDFGWPA